MIKSMDDSSAITKNRISLFNESIRKATHIGALIFPTGYYFSGFDKVEALYVMVPLALLMIIIDISRLRNMWFWRKVAAPIVSPIIRQHEIDGDFTGATYILSSFCLTIALFDKPIAITAIAFIIIGDSFAALIGRKYGKHPFKKNKTIEGSIGCLVGTLIVAMVVPDMILSVAIFGAFAATFFEAFSLGTDDNVTVPLMSGLFMTLFHKLYIYLN